MDEIDNQDWLCDNDIANEGAMLAVTNPIIRQFTGSIVQVNTQTITLPNGSQLNMEIVAHPDGAAVVALNDQGAICLIRQYRAIFDEWFWELPAGKRDENESPDMTARRELAEETGVEASLWQVLGEIVSSPGVFTERVELYLARELRCGEPNIADDEIINEIRWISLDEACRWAQQGKICDAKSIIGILRAAQWLSRS